LLSRRFGEGVGDCACAVLVSSINARDGNTARNFTVGYVFMNRV